ncbi:copper resistance protein NlpE [Shewanella sp. VB17]|uniref:copper resistance protein NlpE n=1 Tax=Shewanella sp. VB17 TaxID=2739432 RepID=UPI001C256CAE|nr:copper resistance protein NlpE [Shewanella sp. VB17]
MKLPLIVLTLLTISMSACSDQKLNVTEKNEKQHIENKVNVSIGDNSQNALDWAGHYSGVIPCASCEGISTVLILSADNTYKLDTQYLGKSDNIFTETGRVQWHKDGGRITLVTLDKDEPGNQYLVGENQLFMLDRQGKKINGNLAQHYRLIKEQ